MGSFQFENTVDITIGLQYVISQTQNVSELQSIISQISDIVGHDGFDISLILKMLLASLPSLVCSFNIVGVVEDIIELNDKKDSGSSIVDVLAIFESISETEIPINVQKLISLNLNKKIQIVNSLFENNDAISTKYNFAINSESTHAEIFLNFMKALIFRMNDEFASFNITDETILLMKNSKYADLKLLDWIKGFYIPLNALTSYTNDNYSLLDYENFLSLEEKVDIILSQIQHNSNSSMIAAIVNNVFLPFVQYYGDEAWNCFNSWIAKFGKKCIQGLENDKIILNYNVLLHLVRQDQLLLSLNRSSDQIRNRFVRTILTIIYLCPKTILQVFMSTKEILVLMKSLNLNDEPNSINLININNKEFDQVIKQLSATPTIVESMINIINVGEILYSDELSIVDIISLENATKQEQLEQLCKYINNEVTFETSDKKWGMFLSSIYSTLKKTNVFNKLSNEELSEAILMKLFDLKQFKVVKTIFEKEFNYIPRDSYQNLVGKQCWNFYMKATNCDPKVGSLKNCVNCLNLLETSSEDYKKLHSLIEANGKLLEWKFYLKPGIPITPKDIVEIGNPIIIIRRILELNDKAYIYSGDLYYLLVLLIDGLGVETQNPLFYHKDKSYDDKSNLLVMKLKLLCLEFSSAVDYKFSFDFAYNLLTIAIKERYEIDGLYDLLSENWFSFFQLSKNEYDDVSELTVINNKLRLLGKLLLITPTDFNTSVLEQWQMLNTQKEHISINNVTSAKMTNNDEGAKLDISLGDVQARLQRSLQSSAEELLNTDGTEIGKAIIGWIVGAN
jgi:hypothetical protein